jgi:hypothetical protein
MKIHSKDFRVKEGHEVDLKRSPTKVDPVYKSKEQNKKLLEEHVEQLSSQQHLPYASDRHHSPWYAVPADDKANARADSIQNRPRYVRGIQNVLPENECKATPRIAVDPQGLTK